MRKSGLCSKTHSWALFFPLKRIRAYVTKIVSLTKLFNRKCFKFIGFSKSILLFETLCKVPTFVCKLKMFQMLNQNQRSKNLFEAVPFTHAHIKILLFHPQSHLKIHFDSESLTVFSLCGPFTPAHMRILLVPSVCSDRSVWSHLITIWLSRVVPPGGIINRPLKCKGYGFLGIKES